MTGKKGYKNLEQKKDARIDYLERMAKWHLYSLDLLASLGELHHSASQDRDPDKIFQITREHLVKILKFEGMVFYLVGEPDSEFIPRYYWPENARSVITKEVDLRINDGSFSWAVNQNRSVVVKADGGDRSLVLHVLSTRQRVRGMFAGLIHKEAPHMEETLQYTLSIILQNTANALESVALYNLFKETNSHLEDKVRERTSDIEDHMRKMREEINSRKLAEESLWEARQEVESILKVKNDWVAQFSQELKTPVNSILAYGDLIRSEMDSADLNRREDHFNAMQLVGKHVLTLIDKFQGLALVGSSSFKIHPKSFEILSLYEDVVRILYPIANQNNSVIDILSDGFSGSIVSDEFRLRQVLLKTVGNACKVSSNDKILIETTLNDENGEAWVSIKVTDHGPGIKPDQLKNLLNKNLNDDWAMDDRVGNGFAFLKSQCQMLGGEVRVTSEWGKGTVVLIRIPREFKASESSGLSATNLDIPGKHNLPPAKPVSSLAKNEAVNRKIMADESSTRRSERAETIWVVDDDSSNSNILCNILSQQGWQVRSAKASMSWISSQEWSLPHLVIVGLGSSQGEVLKFLSDWTSSKMGSKVPILIFAASEVVEGSMESFPPQVKGILVRGNCTRAELVAEIEGILHKGP